jgi:P27 family predicted phage terminase small subunit
MPTPRKTEAAHRLQGTVSQAKDAAAPAVEPGRPKVPKNLPKPARAVFKRMVALLEPRRHITPGDVYLCELFATLYVRRAAAQAKLEAEGEIRTYTRLDSNGAAHEIEKPNLWLKVAETCEKNMVACLDRLGLTPLNRAKVKATGEPAVAPLDPMEEFMSRRRAAAPEFEDQDFEGLVN